MDQIPASFMYVGCETCHRKTDVPYRTMFKCLSTQCKDYKFAVRRYRFCLKATDSSGDLEVTVFGKFGEKILHLNENEFHTQFYPDWLISKDDINNELESVTWKMTILKSTYDLRGSMTISYNVEDMISLQTSNSNVESDPTSNMVPPEISITELLESKSGALYTIIVHAKLRDIPPSFMYVCCETCHCRVDVPVNTKFKCSSTDCTNSKHAIRRYRFCMMVQDSSGELLVTLFGKLGENVLHKKEDEFHKEFHPEWKVSLDEINDKLDNITWRMTIRKTTYVHIGLIAMSYIIEDMVEVQNIIPESETVQFNKSSECYDVLQLTTPTKMDDITSVRVKIEEEEDAKRIRTAETRKKSLQLLEKEIVHVDMEVQEPDQETSDRRSSRARSNKRKTAE